MSSSQPIYGEWEHIANYESGKRDLSITLIDLFGTQMSGDAERWLRLEIEQNEQRITQAKDRMASIKIERDEEKISQDIMRESLGLI